MTAPVWCLAMLAVGAVLVVVAVHQAWRADTMRGPWSVHTGGPHYGGDRAKIVRASTARYRAAAALAALCAIASLIIGLNW